MPHHQRAAARAKAEGLVLIALIALIVLIVLMDVMVQAERQHRSVDA